MKWPFLAPTSGTTGVPKVVSISETKAKIRNELSAKVLGIGKHTVALPLIRADHSYGYLTARLGVRQAGGRVVEQGERLLQDVVREQGVNTLFATATVIIHNESNFLPIAEQIERIIVAGSTLKEEEYQHIVNLFPRTTILNYYASTESGIISVARDEEIAQGGVGHPVIPLRIRHGLIEVSGDTLAEGYVGPPFRPLRGWFCTNDFGELRGGQLFLQGRRRVM